MSEFKSLYTSVVLRTDLQEFRFDFYRNIQGLDKFLNTIFGDFVIGSRQFFQCFIGFWKTFSA